MVVLTVLVKRIEGTVKCYSAIVPDTSIADRDYESIKPWVKAHGNPLRFDEAACIFQIEKKDYAR